MKTRHLLLANLAVLAGCTISSTQPNLVGQDLRLTVFHNADIHSRLIPYDITLDSTDTGLGMFPEAYPYGGAARLRSLYLQQKQSTDRSILVDSGDCFEGAPIFNLNNGEPEYRFMSLFHPDVSTIGNHEFDHGALNLAEQAKAWVDYPLLVANYNWEPWTDPTETMLGEITRPFDIVNIQGLRVGVIGMGNLESLTGLTQGGNTLGANALETNEVAREYVAILAPLSDLILIVSHMGLTQDQDMITGYDDYYPFSSAQPFLACDAVNNPSCTSAAGCCRGPGQAPWMIEDVLPPRNSSEDDDSCELQKGETLLSDGSCPPADFVDIYKLNPNRRVHVFIPPVQNIDVIMGGHIHVVLDPTAVITELVVQYQAALRSDSTDGTAAGCPSSTIGYYTDPGGNPAITGCYSGGLWPDNSYHRNRDGSDVFGAVPNAVPDPITGIGGTWNGQPREVLIQHSGAFAKYLGRLDTVVRMPPASASDLMVNGQPATPEQFALRQDVGGEIVAHDYVPLPIDAAWCLNPRPIRDPYDPSYQQFTAEIDQARVSCAQQEDLETLQLLEPYDEAENTELELPRIFAYTPKEILRFSQGAGEDASLTQNSTLAGSVGGDSELGDAMCEAMRDYQGVNAEWALTNTLGLRDNIYPGPIYLEALFNVFPFEDFLTIQYLSGEELQELLDYVTDVSAASGCSAQAQVAGLTFVQDCGRSIQNDSPSCDSVLPNGQHPEPCTPTCQTTNDCINVLPDGGPSAQFYATTCAGQETPNSPPGTGCECVEGSCYAYSAHNIQVNGTDLDLSASYKGCVNDYIARGGSGYKVLQANTSKTFTGVSLRDALIVYLRQNFCQCDQILAGNPACARLRQNGSIIIDPAAVTYCTSAQALETYLNQLTQEYNEPLETVLADHPERMIAAPNGIWAGSCECRQVLAAQQDPDPNCGHVTPEIKQFCETPTQIAVVTGQEDGRIAISSQ
jgi:2',3'-cyclic-nucleotide 2'-phosphodiesterase (5'-nucleotidase family)